MNWTIFHQPQRQAEHVPVLSRPGEGTRLTVNELGHSTGAPPQGQTFNHPFRPSLGSGSLTFRLGTVQSLAGVGPIEPQIKVNGQFVPMSGKNGTQPTPLDLSGLEPNSDGTSYAAIEVTPDPVTGELQKGALVQIVHTLTPVSHAPNLGRGAIALILWSGKSPLSVYPIVHFNLRYYRILATSGDPTGAPKHLFL